MKLISYLTVIAFGALLTGCAATLPPAELVNAREAYQHANAGQAKQLVPAELHKAETALAIAEKSFQDDPKSFHTRDLAYIADRKAKLAEALAVSAAENATTAKANKDFEAVQGEIVKSTREDLAAAKRSDTLDAEKLAAEGKARLDAESRAAAAESTVAKLAAVKEDARGLVITLSGGVLFASNKSELLPAAQNRLNKVTDALLTMKERKLSIEGYTDSQGSSSYNQVLSQQRADAVRSYIISRGYSADLIQAQGIGEDRPVADNATAGGRANNRRVEIVVEHAAK